MEDKLKELIKSNGYNIRTFAQSIGMAQSTLYGICSNAGGLRNVGIEIFTRIAAGLEMNATELWEVLNDESEPKPQDELVTMVRKLNSEQREVVTSLIRLLNKK